MWQIKTSTKFENKPKFKCHFLKRDLLIKESNNIFLEDKNPIKYYIFIKFEWMNICKSDLLSNHTK